jgi:hypothetical protein
MICIFHNNLQKKIFKNSFMWKKKWEKKNMQFFFKVTPLVRFIAFVPLAPL